MELAPDKAVLYEYCVEHEVETASVRKGQHLLINPGSRIPLDGVVISGNSSVDEQGLIQNAVYTDDNEV